MVLDQIAKNIEFRNGIWYSKSNAQISYPENANDECFQLEDNSFWFRHRNNCIIEIVKRFTSTNESFFDIGGGNGFVSMGLEKSGIETILVEPGESGIQNAKKRNLKNLICTTFESAGFKENIIPNMGLFDVIEHIENDIEFLKKVNYFLKPEGKLFITVPAYNFLWSNEDYEAGHFRRYTINLLQSKLEETGFKILFRSYIFSFLPLPIFLFRSLPYKFKIEQKAGVINKHKKEHEKKGIIGQFLDLILKRELNKIKKAKRISFGASCLIVAQKKY
jgi:SAM-dependent methyltransferase